jgi:disulfide bond formation protein DsbB
VTLSRSIHLSRLVNMAALAALLLVLTGSLYLQFVIGEQPCPLCMIQRSGMIALAIGPLMNLLWGLKPRNYALVILASFVGGAGSVRQILLHIANDTDPAYGPAILGFHMYTWAAIVFGVATVGVALMLMWDGPIEAKEPGLMAEPGRLRALALALFGLVAIYTLVITLSVIPECGLSACPDDPPNTNGMPAWVFFGALALVVIACAVGGRFADARLRRRPTA